MGRYRNEVGRVQYEVAGETITLVTHQRLDDPPPPYSTVSWRSTIGRSPNRRFYWAPTKGGMWHLPFNVARRMLAKAMHDGLLDEEHDDEYGRSNMGGPFPSFVFSTDLSHSRRTLLLNELLSARYPEPAWSDGCQFVVVEEPPQPSGRWRKVMLLNRVTGVFESVVRLEAGRGHAGRLRTDGEAILGSA